MRHYLVSTDYLRMKFVSPVCAPKEPHPLVPPGSDLNHRRYMSENHNSIKLYGILSI